MEKLEVWRLQILENSSCVRTASLKVACKNKLSMSIRCSASKKRGSVPVLENGKSGATLRSPGGFQAQHCAPRCRNQKCKACRGIQSSRYNMTQCAISSMNMSNTSNYARTGRTPQKCERLHISEHCELFSFDLPLHVHEIKRVCLNF